LGDVQTPIADTGYCSEKKSGGVLLAKLRALIAVAKTFPSALARTFHRARAIEG
jgi:hypothetical protein